MKQADFPATKHVCQNADTGGHLEIIKWVRNNSYPWGKFTLAFSVEEDHFETFRWSVENGCPIDKSGDVKILKFKADDHPRDKSIEFTYYLCGIETVKWLEEYRRKKGMRNNLH